MNIIEAILLGVIQGATEFLPISSDGHLVLVPSLLQTAEPDLNIVAIAHAGTLLAVLIYFWRDIVTIATAVIRGVLRRQPLVEPASRLGWFILLGSLPAALIGIAFKDVFERIFSEPVIAAVLLFVTAAFLIAGERLLSGRKEIGAITWADALIIGSLQVLAILPGLSRSGSTIAGGLWRGLDRAAATRFSFLLGIPAITGASLLSLLDVVQSGAFAEQAGLLLVTVITSGVVGYACIRFLLGWVRGHTLYGFAIYCIAFGSLYLIVTLLRGS
jgi:undecaprenyl-diphosphatase